MTEPFPLVIMDRSEELENARAGYQVAVALWS